MAASASVYLLTFLTTIAAPGQLWPPSEHPPVLRRIPIRVDPRVELMGIIFRLAGNEEYQKGTVPSYIEDIEKHFGPFREHEAVQAASMLRLKHRVSYVAPISLAVHLTDASSLQPRVALDPRPARLHGSWRNVDVERFLELVRDFARQSDFDAFVRDHQALYDLTAERMRNTLAKETELDWFEDYYGTTPGVEFSIYLSPTTGSSNYGPKFVGNGRREAYCILGTYALDEKGLPHFPKWMLPTVIHEFNHSFCNPLVSAHIRQLRSAGETLFESRAQQMRKLGYSNWQSMMYESLVRACVVRYLARYEGHRFARAEVSQQQFEGFTWTYALADLLKQYEWNRQIYPKLSDFMPKIVEFFDDWAAQEKAAKDAARQP